MKKNLFNSICLTVLFVSVSFALSPLSPVPTTNLDSSSDSPAAARVDILEAVSRQNFDKKVRLSQFANFSTAKAAIGSTPKTLIIDTTSNVNNLTIPSTLAIDRETNGLITVASGKTLTIGNFIYKGAEHVFTGSGIVTGLKESRPEWFATTPDTAAFTKALAALSVNGTLLMREGTYTGFLTVPTAGIKIKGAGKSYFDSTSGTLKGGTILIGGIDLNNKVGASVENLGIQTTDTTPNGIIQGVDGNTAYLGHVIKNITLLGSYPTILQHAIKLESGTHTTVDGISMYRFYHGIAVKSSYTNISNIYSEDCFVNSVVIKSDTDHPLVENINVNNVLGKKTAYGAGANSIFVSAFNDSVITRNVNVSNINLMNPDVVGINVQTIGTGIIDTVNFSNVVVDTSTGGVPNTSYGFINEGGKNVSVTNMTVKGVVSDSFVNFVGSPPVSVSNVRSIDQGSAAFTGLFVGEPTVLRALANSTTPNVSGGEFWVINNNLSYTSFSVGNIVFKSIGLNDLSQVHSGDTLGKTFEIVIDGTGGTNTFKWRVGSGSWTTGVSMTGATQVLGGGIGIKFAATSGHTMGDTWLIIDTATFGRQITIRAGTAGTIVNSAGIKLKGGIDFVMAADDVLVLTQPSGNLWLEVSRSVNHTLSTYADNAAAVTGGLAAGAEYRTSAGVKMIVY